MSEIVSHAQMTASDVDLLLRAHAELRCLSREVLPVLREIEAPSDLPDDQIGAALTYLELSWLEARRHAAETDSARLALYDAADRESAAKGDAEQSMGALGGGSFLSDNACRYSAAVRRLRSSVAARVEQLLSSQLAGIHATPVVRRLGDGLEAETAASAGADLHAHGSP